MSNTKAIHLKNYKKFMLERGGEELWKKILSELNPADRERASRPVIASEWLDYHLWWRLLGTADRVLGTGDGKIIETLGAYDAHETLTGIYRIFVSIMRPGFIVSHSQSIWERYYDTGIMRVLKFKPNYGELELSDFPDLPVGHEHELIGWMGEALRITGAKNAKVEHLKCSARGDAACLFCAHWE